MLATIAAMALLFAVRLSLAEDSKKEPEKITTTGVLTCQHCGKGFMKKDDPEKAAAGHSKSCATSGSCAKSGYAVIHGNSWWQFDSDSNKLAKDYLSKKESTLKVTVVGTPNADKTLHVTSINPATQEKTKKG
jgi:VCBS repeat-containing protein